jgi:hypothetical protein
MDPTTPPKNIIEQLNAFCQADVKSQWTAKRLKSSRDVCGFSYIENEDGDWVMMPVLCQNCYYTLSQHQINTNTGYNKGFPTNTKESSLSTLAVLPSPLTPTKPEYQVDDNTSTDYLLYQQNKNNNGLEFYRPSLAANTGCCAIL